MPLTLEIVTPERRLLNVQCDEVRAPGVEGGFGIRPGHTPFLSGLMPGALTYVEGGREHLYALGGGFLQVANDRVTVLADTAESKDEIDVARARAALAESTERLKRLSPEEAAAAVERARVERAAARIFVAQR